MHPLVMSGYNPAASTPVHPHTLSLGLTTDIKWLLYSFHLILLLKLHIIISPPPPPPSNKQGRIRGTGTITMHVNRLIKVTYLHAHLFILSLLSTLCPLLLCIHQPFIYICLNSTAWVGSLLTLTYMRTMFNLFALKLITVDRRRDGGR